MKKARYYQKLENGEVKCTACNWYCVLKENEIGNCGTRQNLDGDLFSLIYGKVSSAHVDPIEKKPLYHFLPGSDIFSIGTIGCNFGCGFCQNWDISQVTKEIKSQLLREKKKNEFGGRISDIGMELTPEKIVEYCNEHQIRAIAFTYNEPTIFMEYALDTAWLAKKANIRSVFVTNGFMSKESIAEISKCVSAVNIDLKSFDEKFYRKHCRSKLEPVLDNIKALYDAGIWIELTTLLIPGENDSLKELRKLADFISGISVDIPWHISRFHPDYKMLDKSPTDIADLNHAYDIGKESGLNYIYVGNVESDQHSDTICPDCGEILVRRDGYITEVMDSLDGRGYCASCGQKIAGVWN